MEGMSLLTEEIHCLFPEMSGLADWRSTTYKMPGILLPGSVTKDRHLKMLAECPVPVMVLFLAASC